MANGTFRPLADTDGYASGVWDLDIKERISAAAMQITKPIMIAVVANDCVTSILPSGFNILPA